MSLNSLIKVKPKFLYRSENKFNSLVVGELRLDLTLENIKSDISQYDLFVISNLDFQVNTNIMLKWKVNTVEHQTPITLSKQSKTPFNFNAKSADQITDLHLLISQETALGTEHSFQDEVSFQSIYLDQKNNHNTLTTHLSKWMSFNPVRFSSINSYTENNNLLYKTLILRLCVWLICSVLLFLFMHIQAQHLFSSLFIAWIITTTIHLNNRLHQNQQIKYSFSNTNPSLNLVDRSSNQLALSIKNGLDSILLSPNINNKIILLGGNNFFNQRLLHHMEAYNISLNLLTTELLQADALESKTYIFFGNSKIYCSDLNLFPELNKSVEIIYSAQEFCIVRGI